MVGNASRFNTRGAVPTNTTRRNLLRGIDENDWHCGEAIYFLTALAALLHDLGKASVALQARLRNKLAAVRIDRRIQSVHCRTGSSEICYENERLIQTDCCHCRMTESDPARRFGKGYYTSLLGAVGTGGSCTI